MAIATPGVNTDASHTDASHTYTARGLDRRSEDRRITAATPARFSASVAVPAALVSMGLLVTAAIHVIDMPGREPTYSAAMFLGLIASAIVLAVVVAVRPTMWALGLAGLLSLSVLVGFVLTRTTGLPDWTEDIGVWDEALGLASLACEALTVLFAGVGIFALWSNSRARS